MLSRSLKPSCSQLPCINKLLERSVVGIPPKREANTVIAELVLKGLTYRPRGVPRIKVTFNVKPMDEAQIVAEELREDSAMAGSTV